MKHGNGAVLGIVNKNPLNVKNDPKDRWKGSMGEDEQGHAVFLDMIYGIRAAVHCIRAKWLNKKRTVKAILSEWAEANNRPYIALVCEKLGVKENDELKMFNSRGDITDGILLVKLMSAMAEFENFRGYMIPDETWVSGVAAFEYHRKKG